MHELKKKKLTDEEMAGGPDKATASGTRGSTCTAAAAEGAMKVSAKKKIKKKKE